MKRNPKSWITMYNCNFGCNGCNATLHIAHCTYCSISLCSVFCWFLFHFLLFSLFVFYFLSMSVHILIMLWLWHCICMCNVYLVFFVHEYSTRIKDEDVDNYFFYLNFWSNERYNLMQKIQIVESYEKNGQSDASSLEYPWFERNDQPKNAFRIKCHIPLKIFSMNFGIECTHSSDCAAFGGNGKKPTKRINYLIVMSSFFVFVIRIYRYLCNEQQLWNILWYVPQYSIPLHAIAFWLWINDMNGKIN